MEQSSFYDETTVRHQFDRKCKLALDDEVVDYDRHMDYRRRMKYCFRNYLNARQENFRCWMNIIWKYIDFK